MKTIYLFVLFISLIFGLTGCKEVKKTSSPPGINVMIQDLSCEEVLERIHKELRRQNLSFEWVEKDRGILKVGPTVTNPLPADLFIRMEEKIHLEIKCLAPFSTRIALQVEIKGLAADNRWTEIKEADKLNAYGKRFLDRLLVN